jgi:hypothetical protein
MPGKSRVRQSAELYRNVNSRQRVLGIFAYSVPTKKREKPAFLLALKSA